MIAHPQSSSLTPAEYLGWELTPYSSGEIVQLTCIDFACAIELLYEEVDL